MYIQCVNIAHTGTGPGGSQGPTPKVQYDKEIYDDVSKGFQILLGGMDAHSYCASNPPSR